MSTSTSSPSQTAALPPKIIDCFDQFLPHLGKSPAARGSAGNSGTQTAAAKEPRVLKDISIKPCLDIATKLLKDHHKTFDQHLHELRLATSFDNIALDNEQEVVSASLLYLIRPILEVLKVRYRDQWTLHAEFSAPVVNHALQGTSILATGSNGPPNAKPGSVRYDLIFKKRNGSTIAVLEYKKRGMLRFKHFENVWVKSTTPPHTLRQLKLGNQSALEGNARPYMKQVSM